MLFLDQPMCWLEQEHTTKFYYARYQRRLRVRRCVSFDAQLWSKGQFSRISVRPLSLQLYLQPTFDLQVRSMASQVQAIRPLAEDLQLTKVCAKTLTESFWIWRDSCSSIVRQRLENCYFFDLLFALTNSCSRNFHALGISLSLIRVSA